jgi:hypothetical protein
MTFTGIKVGKIDKNFPNVYAWAPPIGLRIKTGPLPFLTDHNYSFPTLQNPVVFRRKIMYSVS